jgi:uncharacterized RDD family membrane protein YckC
MPQFCGLNHVRRKIQWACYPVGVLRKYQTFWPRFWAGWIDGLALGPLWLLDWGVQSATNAPIVLAVWFILFTVSFDVYTVVMHAKYGQTLGKMVLGIKVLDVSETKLSFRQSALRDIVPIVLSVTTICVGLPRVFAGLDPYKGSAELNWLDEFWLYGSLIWFVAELATMLTNAKRRAVHDFIAGSVVVRVGNLEGEVTHDAAVA